MRMDPETITMPPFTERGTSESYEWVPHALKAPREIEQTLERPGEPADGSDTADLLDQAEKGVEDIGRSSGASCSATS